MHDAQYLHNNIPLTASEFHFERFFFYHFFADFVSFYDFFSGFVIYDYNRMNCSN